MNNHLANVAQNHPHTTTYLITFISSIISLIIGELFSLAVIRFAQELVTYRKPTQPFYMTVLLALRHQTWPWGKSVENAKYLMTKDRWWPAVSVILCALIFPHLTSSTATLLTPTSFNRTAVLTGTELDFSSTDAECLSWFENNPMNGSCGWQVSWLYPEYRVQNVSLTYACCSQIYKNSFEYANCFAAVDLLDAGHGKVSYITQVQLYA